MIYSRKKMMDNNELRKLSGLPLTESEQLDEAKLGLKSRVAILSKDKKTLLYTGTIIRQQPDGNFVIKPDQKNTMELVYSSKDLIASNI